MSGGATTAWILNTAGLLLATVGAILMYVYPASSRSVAVAASRKHNLLSKLAVGLLAAGFLLQYLGAIA
jgi:hypothetical protein